MRHYAALLICGGVLAGCFEAPPPPNFGDVAASVVEDVVDGEAEVATATGDDTETAQAAPLCPDGVPCDVHCFQEAAWSNGSVVMACVERRDVSAGAAQGFQTDHCSKAIGEGGATLGRCPLSSGLADAGWGPMTQGGGCHNPATGLLRWFYGLDAGQLYGPNQYGPTVKEVAAFCDLSEVTVLQCVPTEGCEGGECVPDGLCTDEDTHPCTTLACAPGSSSDDLCDLTLDDTVCNDAKSCTTDKCSADKGCFPEHDDAACPDETCRTGACLGEAANDPSGCEYTPRSPEVLCDDGDACTVDDHCQEGACEGKPKNCDSENTDCTEGTCLGGICTPIATNTNADCTSTDPCAAVATCNLGICTTTQEIDCDEESSDCLIGVCINGSCVGQPANTGQACSADDPCLSGATCNGGACVAVSVTDCDDDDPCTADLCQVSDTGEAVCANEPLSNVPCNDEEPCTLQDRCDAGVCGGATLVCDDGDACTTDACVAECPQSNPDDCDLQTEGEGKCSFSAIDGCNCCVARPTVAGCSSDDIHTCVCAQDATCCNEGDDLGWDEACVVIANTQCDAGCGTCGDAVCEASVGESFATCPADCDECATDSECDDDNGCTEDTCGEGTCLYADRDGEACNDGELCTAPDACVMTSCEGPVLNTPLCTGACEITLGAPQAWSETTRSVGVRIKTSEPGEALSGVVYSAGDDGLRRYAFEEQSPGGAVTFTEATGPPAAFKTVGSPKDMVLLGKIDGCNSEEAEKCSAVAYVAMPDALEIVFVGAMELPKHQATYPSPGQALLAPPLAIAVAPAVVDPPAANPAPPAPPAELPMLRLFMVSAEGFELLDISNVQDVKPVATFTNEEINGFFGFVDHPVTQMVDVAVDGHHVYLLDEQAGLVTVVMPGGDPESGSQVSVQVLADKAGMAASDLRPEAIVVDPREAHSVVYVLAKVSDAGMYLLFAVHPESSEVLWSHPIEQQTVTDIAAGGCGGLTLGLGPGGLGWISVLEPTAQPGELVTGDVGVHVEALTVSDDCLDDNSGRALAAIGGAGGGAALATATISTPGTLQFQGLTGGLVRTGWATEVAVVETDSRTTAFVADRTGQRAFSSGSDSQHAGVRIYDVSNPEFPKALASCSLGEGQPDVRAMVHDGLDDYVHAVIAEGDEGELSHLVTMAADAPDPCEHCFGCSAYLGTATLNGGFFETVWLNPRAAMPYQQAIPNDPQSWCSYPYYRDLIVVGSGGVWLQIFDVSLCGNYVFQFQALLSNRFPTASCAGAGPCEGFTGLTAITGDTHDNLVVVGTAGEGERLILLSESEVYGLGSAPLSPHSLFDLDGVPLTVRPVAMALEDGLLYVLLDDPAEVDGTADCQDCQPGTLWIVDVSNPEAPLTKYTGALTGTLDGVTGPFNDLQNPSDIRVSGGKLFIASQGLGLLVADLTNPFSPVLVDGSNPGGQVSGMAFAPDRAFMAAGQTPLATVPIISCE